MDPRLLSRKTKSTMGGGLNEVAAQQPSASDFGARMLAKFGWKEGDGLGKRRDGMKEHIRVKQRQDGLGLGADDKPVSEWAAVAQKVVPLKREDATDGDDSDSDDAAEVAVRRRIEGSGVIPGMSDEDLFKICGGARLGMRARAKQDGKQARMEEADRQLAEQRAAAAAAKASKTATSSSSSSSSSAAAERAAAAVMEAKAKKESKKRERLEGSQLPRSSPRLQAAAAAKAAAAITDLALEGGHGGDEGGDAGDKAARKAAKKAAKKEAKRLAKKEAKHAAKKARKE